MMRRVLLTGFMVFALAAAVAARPSAILSGARGDVRVERGGTGIPASINMDMLPGDRIVTGADGMAVLLYHDGTAVKLNVNSDFRLDDPSGAAASAGALDMGELWSLVKPEADAVRVMTPSAVVAVRGTELLLSVRTDQSLLTVVAGKVEFFNDAGSVYVTDSQESLARKGSAPASPQVVDYKNRLRWTADIQSVGLLFERRLLNTPADRLRQRAEELAAAHRGNPDDAGVAADYGAALADAGDVSAAAAHLKQVVDKQPGNAAARRWYGYVLLSIGDTAAARAQFEKATELDGKDADTKLGAGLCDLRDGAIKEARAGFEAALAMDDTFGLARVALALAAMRDGDSPEALAQLEMAVNTNPPYQAWAYLSLVKLSSGDAAAALVAAETSLRAAPRSALALSARARVLFFNGAYGAARRDAETALSANPRAAFPHSVLADAFLVDHRPDRALKHAFRAAALDENNVFAFQALARAQDAAGHTSSAMRSYEHALILSPDSVQARSDFARLLARINRYDDAKEQIDMILKIKPGFAPAYDTLGGVAFESNRTRDAIGSYEKAVALDPELADSWAGLSRAYLRDGRLQQALEAAQRAIKLEPGNPWHYVDLGTIHDQTYGIDSAALNYRHALAIDPDNALAHAFIGRQLLSGINTASYDNVKRGTGEYNRAVLQDPGVPFRELRRGHFTLDAFRGNNRSRYYDLLWAFQEDDARLTYQIHSKQYETDGGRLNGGQTVTTNELWVSYAQDWRRAWALKLTGFRQISGVPGSALNRDGDGDPDDSNAIVRSGIELSHRFSFSDKNYIRLRAQITSPFGKSHETFFRTYEGALNDVNQLVFHQDPTEIFRYKFNHAEISHNTKWNPRHTLAYGFARYDDRYWVDTYGWTQTAGSNPPAAEQTHTYALQKQTAFVAYAQDTWDITRSVQLRAMAKRESANVEGRQTGYRAALTWKTGPRTRVHALAAQNLGLFHIPYYLPMEYWSLSDRHATNFRSARSIQYELDIEHEFKDRSFFKLGFFQFNARHYNAYDPATIKFRTRQQGLRASYERPLGRRTTAMFDYRWIPHRFRSPGYLYDKNLMKDKGTYSAGIFLTHLRENGFGFQGSCIRNSAFYADDANFMRIPDHTYCDARFFYDRNDRLRLYLTVWNFTNKRYQLSAGIPEPRRTWMLGLQQFY
jgi:tetratricopeptide (TPR) repeat protein